MNTPAHIAVNLALIGRRASPVHWWVVVAGAILPDAAYFVDHFARGALPERTADLFNSVPLWGLVLLVASLSGTRWAVLLAASALLHIAADIPLHAGDAHLHFWPLTDWRFVSPVSFWDADHHGRLVGTLEGVIFALAVAACWGPVGRWRRAALVLLSLTYLAAFVHFVGHVWAGEHWAIW
ncbi:hypothetical protein [Pelagovum pacificum]|uniref:Cobalamin biosynthesis protein CobQ n=1 Tax=Pelagovum pacificum TaxID=2588711 RepID=A0A5C5G8L5_9RHOB|nr:hypothetical protein [Pelagovum pacificum]QQA41611.1 hypothetical protein I8N54_12365 [Pelagovum pacificum]TNY30891.1 hypothetical protein FHY64_17440 [Pelagovum pacificum]